MPTTTERRRAAGRTTRKKKAQPTIRRLSAVIRVSQRNGRDGASFLSPEQQRDIILGGAKALGATVTSWHDESDSVSGRTTERVGLQAAIAEVLDGRTDGLIVAKVDRFSRSLTEGLAAVRKLHEADKAFIAVNDGVFSWDPTDFGAKVLLTVLLLFAEWQLDTLTAGWADVQARCVKDGVPIFGTPYGYRRGERQLVPDPAVAQWVRRIYKWRAAGDSWITIADRLTEKGAPTPNDVRGRSSGSTWSHVMVRRIVVNRVYLGELRSGDLFNPAAHKPLVNADLWQAANGMPKTANRAANGVYPLAGIVRCASCGGRMGGANGNNRSYRCRRRYSWGACPAPVYVRADELEDLVTARLFREVEGERFKSLVVRDGVAEATTELRAAEAELAAYTKGAVARRLRSEHAEAYEAGLIERMDAVDVARDHLAAAERRSFGAHIPDDLTTIWSDLHSEQQRLIISAVFPVVAVARAGRGNRSPVVDRVRVWIRGERDLPDALPGRDGVRGIRPIVVVDQ